MSTQHVAVDATSAAPPDVVWSLLSDVTTWPSWSGFTAAGYERGGDPAPHGVGAVRVLRAGRLRSRETVLAFEPPTRFAYDYTGSLPLVDYRADVVLAPDGSGTRITWSASFRTRRPVPGAVGRLVVRKVLADVSRRLAGGAEQQTRAAARAERSGR